MKITVFLILAVFVFACSSSKHTTQMAQREKDARMNAVGKPIGKITESGDTLRIVGVREITFEDGTTRNVALMMSTIAPVVQVNRNKDGTVRNVKVLHSSGNPAIDDEGIRKIKDEYETIKIRHYSENPSSVRGGSFIHAVSYLFPVPE